MPGPKKPADCWNCGTAPETVAVNIVMRDGRREPRVIYRCPSCGRMTHAGGGRSGARRRNWKAKRGSRLC